jgi:hypothetical protein
MRLSTPSGGAAEPANKVGYFALKVDYFIAQVAYFTVKVVNFIAKVADFNSQLTHRPANPAARQQTLGGGEVSL